MNTLTHAATAITTEEHLIIAGDAIDPTISLRYKSTVENSGHWHSLYQLLPHASSTLILNNTLYLIGGYNQGKKVFYTSLPALLGSDHQLEHTHRCPTGPALLYSDQNL